MSLGQGTQVVDGQRNLFPTSAAYAPASYGPQTTGVPNISPTMPPYIGAANTGGGIGPGAGSEGVGGYGTAGNNAVVTAIAAANPHNLKVSPVWWAVFALLIGLLLLNGVHWRKVVDEDASVHAHLGAAKADASEGAGA